MDRFANSKFPHRDAGSSENQSSLREPPPAVRQELENGADHDRFVILPATGDVAELSLTVASLDAVLHTSVIGESFGYGIAEPMNYAKPVIANSTPWQDQAQIELVRSGECGFIASTPQTVAEAILKLANSVELRAILGRNAQSHIRQLADPAESTDRLEGALRAAIAGNENSRAAEDLASEGQDGGRLPRPTTIRPFLARTDGASSFVLPRAFS